MKEQTIALLKYIVFSAFIFASYGGSDGSSSVSTRNKADNTIKNILQQVKAWRESTDWADRPFVTLTFAQSLDGKIAAYEDSSADDSTTGRTSSNLPLSGEDSLRMTHALRSVHDAILIGGGTLAVDNPRLSNRLWGNPEQQSQPRPIILDTEVRSIRRLTEKSSLKARDIVVCCSQDAAKEWKPTESITLLPCPTNASGKLDLRGVLKRLQAEHGIKSIMVEGGSEILSSFAQTNLFDCLCVTIAPKIIGMAGLSAFRFQTRLCSNDGDPNSHNVMNLSDVQYTSLGNDCILLSRGQATASDDTR